MLVSLAISILIVGSLIVGSCIATPDQPLDQNPQAENYNSSRSNTSTSIYTGEDITGKLWIGIFHITEEGVLQAGTYGGNMVELKFSEFGDIIVSESLHNPEFDGKMLEAIDKALSVWEKEMIIGDAPIAINEEGLSR